MNYDLQPMLCPSGQARQTIPADIDLDAYACEPKLDGWRLICHRNQDSVHVYGGRNGASYTGQLPYLEAALMEALPPDTIVDGEIMAPQGWGGVQHTMRSGQPHRPSEHSPALTLWIFDVLRVTGNDVRRQPWTNRRRLVELIVLGEHMAITPIIPTAESSLEAALTAGFEGVVLKLKSSRYVNGRAPAWIKVKPQSTAEARVTGFKAGEGSFAGLVGALEFEMLDTGAASRCSGFDMALRREITAHPEQWLGQVIEIKHHGIGKEGKPRHPQFLRRRDDRTPVAAAPTPTIRRTAVNGKMRNYAAMGDAKLLRCVDELVDREGDAYDRCVAKGSGDPESDLRVARGVATERGL